MSFQDLTIRTEYLHNDFRSNALLSAVNIARARNDDEVDEFASLDSIIDYTEMLAYSGFGELAEMLGKIKVSAKQSPAYQSMPEYETISKRLEKLQVSFSRKTERVGYDGRRVGSEG